MIKRKYDKILIGFNYISLIRGISLIQEGKSVLIINDPNSKLSDNWIGNLTLLDLSYLKSELKRLGLSSRISLNQLINPIKTILYFDDILLELGSSPFINFLELYRKGIFTNMEKLDRFLEKYDEKSFNKIYMDLIRNLEVLLHQGDLKKFFTKTSQFEKAFQLDLSFIKDHFYYQYPKTGKDDLQFLFALQTIYRPFISNKISYPEYLFLLTQSLSPCFRLDQVDITGKLLRVFKAIGGEFSSFPITDWEFVNNNCENVLLNSFDGLVQTENIEFYSELKENHPFQYSFNEKILNSLEFYLTLQHDYLNSLKNSRIIALKKDSLGTDDPFINLEIGDNHLIKFNYTYKLGQGIIDSFYIEKGKEQLWNILNRIFPGIDHHVQVEVLGHIKSSQIWREMLYSKRAFFKHSTFIHQKQKVKRECGLVLKNNQKVLSNVIYRGGLSFGHLGLGDYFARVTS